jgi:hypothetical protein
MSINSAPTDARPHLWVLPISLAVLAAAALAAGLGSGHADSNLRAAAPIADADCAQLARAVAHRSQSILEPDKFRRTAEQAYGICLSDPAAFRRIVR